MTFQKDNIPWNRGKKHSLKTRLKIGEANRKRGSLSLKTRQKISKSLEGKNTWSKGKYLSEKTKRKISTNNGKYWLGSKPEDNPAWLGGKSFEPYDPRFNKKLKLRIRERDNFTCQECGYTEEQLEYILRIHHIDYDKKNNQEENLISLCRNCHAQTNFSREDWIKYFWSYNQFKKYGRIIYPVQT